MVEGWPWANALMSTLTLCLLLLVTVQYHLL